MIRTDLGGGLTALDVVVSHHIPRVDRGGCRLVFRRPLWRRILAGRTHDVVPVLEPGDSYRMGRTLIVAPETYLALQRKGMFRG